MKSIQTDIAIFGDSIGSAYLARSLHQKTLLKIDIFQDGQHAGLQHSIQTPNGSFDSGPQPLPAKAETKEALSRLSEVLGRNIANESTQALNLKAFEKGEFSSYVGFGSKKPEAIEEWDQYLAPDRTTLTLPIYALHQELMKDVPATTHVKSEITKIEVEDGKIKHIVVNGDVQVEAKAYVLFLNPLEAVKFLPQNQVDAKLRQKLSKSKAWTSISVTMIHKGEVGNYEEPLVLIGPGDVPFVAYGEFRTPQQETGKLLQASQWITLLAPEEGEEEEAYAQSLRDLKRMLEKAYPKYAEGVVFEKISVNTKSHGHVDLKMEKDESFQGFNNLWLGHSSLSGGGHLAHSVARAQELSLALQTRFEAAQRDLPEATAESSGILGV